MSELDVYVRVLRDGGVVAAPTDTFFGLLADPFSDRALQRLCDLKQSPPGRPWPLLVPEHYDLSRIECPLPPAGERLARRHWPGKLTLVVPCGGELARRVGRDTDGSVGVRVPGGPEALLELLRLWDGPLTGTSANPAGAEPARDAQTVRDYFPLLTCLPGSTPGGAPSTVVDATREPVRIVREGELSAQEIFAERAS